MSKQQNITIMHAKDGVWETRGLRQDFEYRDLGVKDATQGRYMAQFVRPTDLAKPPISAHSHTLDLQLVYMVKGWMRFWHEDRGEVTMHAGDFMLQPGGLKHSVIDWSPDFELLEITSPGDFPTHEDSDQSAQASA